MQGPKFCDWAKEDVFAQWMLHHQSLGQNPSLSQCSVLLSYHKIEAQTGRSVSSVVLVCAFPPLRFASIEQGFFLFTDPGNQTLSNGREASAAAGRGVLPYDSRPGWGWVYRHFIFIPTHNAYLIKNKAFRNLLVTSWHSTTTKHIIGWMFLIKLKYCKVVLSSV